MSLKIVNMTISLTIVYVNEFLTNIISLTNLTDELFHAAVI